MKGFKKDGKFRPTGKRNKSSLRKQDVLFKKPISFGDDPYEFQKQKAGLKENFEQQVYDFKELNDSAKQHALSEYKEDIENEPFYYTEDEGILYDVDMKPQFAGHDVFQDVIPKGWSGLDGYGYPVIQFDLKMREHGDEYPKSKDAYKLLEKYLGLTGSLEGRITFDFPTKSEENTTISFRDFETGEDMDVYDYKNYADYKVDMDSEYVPKLTEKQFDRVNKAKEKFDELMKKSAKNLMANYEWYHNDKNLIEELETRGEEYDKYGGINRMEVKNGEFV